MNVRASQLKRITTTATSTNPNNRTTKNPKPKPNSNNKMTQTMTRSDKEKIAAANKRAVGGSCVLLSPAEKGCHALTQVSKGGWKRVISFQLASSQLMLASNKGSFPPWP